MSDDPLESEDPLENGDLRLYVFQLGNGCMDTANELGLMGWEGTSLEIIMNGFAEILHQLSGFMPDKEEVVNKRKRREKLRKTK
jgi:hypothetical protein